MYAEGHLRDSLTIALSDQQIHAYTLAAWRHAVFCQKCGSDLPAIAKYCAKCGSPVRTSPPSAVGGSFCVNCGKPYEPSFKFCNYCGHAIPLPQNQPPARGPSVVSTAAPQHETSTPTSVQMPTPITEGQLAESHYADVYSRMSNDELIQLSVEKAQLRSEAQSALTSEMLRRGLAEPPTAVQQATLSAATISARKSSARYALFTLWFLASVGLCSCAVFVIAYAIAAGTLGPTAASSLTASLLLMFLATVGVVKTWKRIVAAESPVDDVNLRRRRKRVVVKGVVLALLLFSMSAGVGYAIGQSGVETAQVLADLAEERTLGDRISKTRTPDGNPGIGWYVQMYPQIESDVNSLDAVLHRLTTEYPAYSAKFPEQDPSNQTMTTVNNGIRRMALLEQEIAVAKKIEFLDEKEQLLIWTNEMYPLLKAEDALDSK